MPQPFFKLRTFPGYNWPAVPAGGNARVWSAYQSLTQSQWLSGQELLDQQLNQIRALLHHCYKHTPYYRALLQAHAILPEQIQTVADFRRLPLLQRRDLQQNFTAIQAKTLPVGTQAAGSSATSGTTGEPVQILYTNVTRLWWNALFLRDLEWCVLDPRKTIAVIRPMHGNPEPRILPAWSPGLNELIESGPCHVLSTHADPERQMAWLQHIQPDYLLSSPSNLAHLATLPGAQKLGRLQTIQAVHEALPEVIRQGIETGFGVPVKNTYSCEEAGYLASPCPEDKRGHTWHIHAENVLLEILDENNQPCTAGQTGKVVLTLLQNYRSPLIRYQIGDLATLGERCRCGRKLPVLSRIEGKTRPLLALADGSRRDPQVLLDLLLDVSAIRQFQLIQHHPGKLLIRLVPDKGYGTQQAQQIQTIVHQHLGFNPQLELVKRIPLLPNGKQSGVQVYC